MIALSKALPLGVALTMIFAFMFNSYSAYSRYFLIDSVNFSYFQFYWSWPVFAGATAIGWFLFWLIER